MLFVLRLAQYFASLSSGFHSISRPSPILTLICLIDEIFISTVPELWLLPFIRQKETLQMIKSSILDGEVILDYLGES